MTVGELKAVNDRLVKENETMRGQLMQASQMLQSQELANKKFELDRINSLITMYQVLISSDKTEKSTIDLYFADITGSLVRVPEEFSDSDEIDGVSEPQSENKIMSISK